MSTQRESQQQGSVSGSNPSPKGQDFGKLFSETRQGGDGDGVRAESGAAKGGPGSLGPFWSGDVEGGSGGRAPGRGSGQSPNLGFQRKSGKKRVIGGARSVRDHHVDVVKSYSVAGGIQFNDVEEMRGDAISRAYAQEILERLWAKWQIDTSRADLMRKAEDVVHALFAMRTASPDADYGVFVLLGDKEVNLQDLSDLLYGEEVTRRRFARAIANDIRAYISEPDNVRLREMLSVELGIPPQYAHLAFDGSTHCSGMSANQIMFTKQLEHKNLFDSPEVRDRLASTQMMATGQFQVNKGRSGAY